MCGAAFFVQDCAAMPATDDLDNHFGRYISLVTFKRSGDGVATPVWFAADGASIYVFTDGTSYKVKRLRRNARIRIAACGSGGRVTGDWHDGNGRVVEDAEIEQRAYTLLMKRYGWQMKLVNLLSTLGGRIGRRAILELTIGG